MGHRNSPKPYINKRKHYKYYSKIDIHFNKQLIKTGCKAFCRPFGKDEAWFIKTGRGKKFLYLNLFDAKGLITEESLFLLYENVTENKGI